MMCNLYTALDAERSACTMENRIGQLPEIGVYKDNSMMHAASFRVTICFPINVN
jgi:hypothetical protein